MSIHRPNAFIDHILRWENRDIIQHRLYRDCFRRSYFTPEQAYSPNTSAAGESYYTYTWEMGGAPPEVEIDILTDRYPPPASGKSYAGPPRLHNHDFFEILYVYSGSCVTLISGKEHELRSGDICLYNLQALHYVRKCKPEDVLFNILIRRDLFQRSFLNLLAENDLITDFFLQSIYSIDSRAGQIVLSPAPEYHCEEIAQQMIELHYREKPMEQSMLKALLVVLLGEIALQYRSQFAREDQSPSQAPSLSQVISYISKHSGTITLEQLSAHFGYTLRSMTRYIKAHTGTTFKKIVQQIRFYQACHMLRTTDQPIEAISAQSGYTERASFDRAFKQAYHVTPYEYRMYYQKGGNAAIGVPPKG